MNIMVNSKNDVPAIFFGIAMGMVFVAVLVAIFASQHATAV